MVYTSDLRGKHILRDLHDDILDELKKIGLEKKLFLRIFDDPSEDNKLWEDGGITFVDPESNKTLGNNDAAWYVTKDQKSIPLIVVEATFSTERGQFGDGQFNRFSHPLAPAKLGYIGIMLIPFKGESYSKINGISEKNTDFASLKYAHLNKNMVQAALGVSQKELGHYLIIDFYDIKLLKSLIIEKTKENFGLDSKLTSILLFIKNKMKNYSGNEIKIRNKIDKLYNNKGDIIPKSFGYIFTQNFLAFTSSSKRDGHGALGKILCLPYIYPNEEMYAIFLRLNSDEIKQLRKRTGKEISYIFKNPKIHVISLDKLQFSDKILKNKLIKIKDINLFQNRKTDLINSVRNKIKNGDILIT